MINIKNECGIIPNFLTIDELEEIVKTFKKFKSSKNNPNSAIYTAQLFSIDSNHLAYPWFKKVILNKLHQIVHPDLKLIYGGFQNAVKPADIHQDEFFNIDDPYACFLIPYAVDNDTNLVSNSSTIFFNQDPPMSSTFDIKKVSHVGHQLDLFNQLGFKQECVWKTGDLLYWDCSLYHASNNFLDSGFSSKQCIVIHTYI
jgi:hypothetical protein